MASRDFPWRITSTAGWKVLFRLGRKGSDQIQSLCSNHGTKARMWPERFMFLWLHSESPVQQRLIFLENLSVLTAQLWSQIWLQQHEHELQLTTGSDLHSFLNIMLRYLPRSQQNHTDKMSNQMYLEPVKQLTSMSDRLCSTQFIIGKAKINLFTNTFCGSPWTAHMCSLVYHTSWAKR